MRLIIAEALIREEKFPFAEFTEKSLPKYAILSHRWEDPEVTYADFRSGVARSMRGYQKILRTCQKAISKGLEYVWVDTCCIDKSSSAELTEAINSMYAWYGKAEICLVFLSDISGRNNLKRAAWFKRGWTLQELIAPYSMEFFDQSWEYIGSKNRSRRGEKASSQRSLLQELSKITKVNDRVLSHDLPLSSVCVAQRLSWAADRETTRVEDIAYCLLGILEINMAPIYGEGEKAFYRLQEEIIKSSYDPSILAWCPTSPEGKEYCGFLAESPQDFRNCSDMQLLPGPVLDTGEIEVSNKGLVVTTPEYILISSEERSASRHQYALKLSCRKPGLQEDFYTVVMRKIGPNLFVRTRWVDTDSFELVPVDYRENERKVFVLLTKIPWTETPLRSLVSASRHTQVEVRLFDMGETRTIEMPLRAWDVQDYAFFGAHTSPQNWGAMSFDDSVFFVCLWCLEAGEWIFEIYLLDSKARRLRDVSKQLLYYSESFGYRTGSVMSMLSDAGVRAQRQIVGKEGLWLKLRNFSLTCYRLTDDREASSGPRWVVEMREE